MTDQVETSQQEAYLHWSMAQLWPPPARVRSVNRWRPPAGPGREYLVIPSAANPKLVVPARPAALAAAAVRNYNTGAGAHAQRKAAALALAVRFGLGRLLPNRLVVDLPADGATDGIDRYLATVLERPVHISLHVTPPRAVRKPVLQLLDDHGSTYAFAKLGVDEFTDALVADEAAAVSSVADRSWSALQVPQVLYAGTWRGHQLLVQAAFGRGRAVALGDPILTAAMIELADSGGRIETPLTDSPYLARLHSRVAALPESAYRSTIAASLRELVAAAGSSPLALGASHGDWAPWNMTVLQQRVCVWDWEKFERDVPVGFDAVHFDVHGQSLAGVAAGPAFESALAHSADYLRPLPVGAEQASILVWLYALDLGARYLEDGELEAGDTPMSRLDAWLAPTLRRAADHSRPS